MGSAVWMQELVSPGHWGMETIFEVLAVFKAAQPL